MMTTAAERKILKLMEANERTNNRQVYYSVCPVDNDTDNGGRTVALMTRLDRKYREREREMTEIACKEITGKGWGEFVRSVRGGYTPSVSKDQHPGLIIDIFSEDFKKYFGREVYIY